MEEFKSIKLKEAIPTEDISVKENKSEFTKFNEQKTEEEREKIKGLMKKNEEIKKKLENLST